MSNRLIALLLLLGCTLFAAQPIATLTAGARVLINGRPVQTTGAPNWPVSAGDTLLTGPAGAVVTFPDGTTLNLAPNTKLALANSGPCVANVSQGSVKFKKPAASKFELCANGTPVEAASGTQGSVTVDPSGKVAVKRTPAGISTGTKVAIGAGAAAAAAGTTVAVTRPKDKSPKGKAKGQ